MPSPHRIPVIERMMDVLGQLERADDPRSVSDLATGTRVPRTTVYRILNTLEAHGVVARAGADGYRLGSRLVALAAAVPDGSQWRRMAELAQPWLRRLAGETGETAKLSVRDGGAVVCVAVERGAGPYALAPLLGARYPLHAGAASKVLLAAMDPAEAEAVLAAPLARFTSRTMTDPAALRRQLDRIRRQGWAEDTGEHGPGVRALAAPVRNAAGSVEAALSVAHLADRGAAERRGFRDAVCSAATSMTLG